MLLEGPFSFDSQNEIVQGADVFRSRGAYSGTTEFSVKPESFFWSFCASGFQVFLQWKAKYMPLSSASFSLPWFATAEDFFFFNSSKVLFFFFAVLEECNLS